MNKKINIAVVNNNTNIGNQFFELSIIHDLKNVFGSRASVYSAEGRSVFPNHFFTGRKSCYLEYGRYTSADYYVFSGPVFSRQFHMNFEKILGSLADRGTKFIFLSAGSNEYSEQEKHRVRAFLNNIKPVAISTRDQWTYDAYHDLAEYSHNGICSAFFSSFHFPGYETPELEKYVVLNFEEAPEPDIARCSLEDPDQFHLRREEIERCVKTSKLQILLDAVKPYSTHCNGYELVRTFHSAVPSPYKTLVNRPNKFVSTNPYSYLNIYRNASLVLARRVHACVAALSYGSPAMLFGDTERARLFDRLDLRDIRSRPVILKKSLLDSEREKFTDFLGRLKNYLYS